jgi:hypothetical protein
MTPTPEQIARAFAIADEAMFTRFERYTRCKAPGDYNNLVPLSALHTDCTLVEAPMKLREAFEWLRQREYVELGQDKDGEFIHVLRRPGEE